MTARFIVGDVFDGLASLPDDSVDLVLTSPPFLALRSYLPPDHPDKAKEIGSEATPADFIDTLLDVVEAIDRVLAPHGSLVFELGDTYSGSGNGPDANQEGRGLWDEGRSPRQVGLAAGGRANRAADEALGLTPHRVRPGPKDRDSIPGWPLAKSLCGIPTLFAWSLAYGRNLLRPERTTEPWRIRNVVAWCRPNPPVGALGDKVRPATSYLTVACKSRTRWFDLDAVRGPGSPNTHTRLAARDREATGSRRNRGKAADDERRGGNFSTLPIVDSDGTSPPLDYWVIPTAPYKGSHYATWPPALLTRPILSMCPLKVCMVCGEPSRRIVEAAYVPDFGGGSASTRRDATEPDGNDRGINGGPRMAVANRTLGWTDCGHGPLLQRNGVVLDPFAGSGTTLQVATGHGRDAIGIDLDERNADLALERVGMFLTVEHLEEAVA